MRTVEPLIAGDPGRLAGYRLLGRLGEGGQGTVYLGRARRGQVVAIKVLHARLSGDQSARARLAREVDAARKVAPFCTARVLAADPFAKTPYIVSEFVDGPPLTDAVSAYGPMSGQGLEQLAVSTITALAAIHRAGIVHRDFKPANVLVSPAGVRVVDFGIARLLEATTVTSTVMGTPSYMAPEQVNGQSATPAIDVFAWAGTMVYAANAFPPFGQDSVQAVSFRVLGGDPELGALSGPLRDLVSECLAKNPADRPTAEEVLSRLLGNDSRTYPASASRRNASFPEVYAAPTLDPHEPSPAPRNSFFFGTWPRRVLWGTGISLAAALAVTLAVQLVPDRTRPPAAAKPTAEPVRFVRETAGAAKGASVTFEAHRLTTRSVAYSPKGGLLATGSEDGEVRLWNTTTATPKLVGTISAERSYPGAASMKFTVRGDLLATRSGDHTQLWDVRNPAKARPVSFASGFRFDTTMAVDPRGRLLASASNREIGLWNITDPTDIVRLANIPAPSYGSVDSLAFGPDGRTLLGQVSNGVLQQWRLDASGRFLSTSLPGFAASNGNFDEEAMSASPDGRVLVTQTENGMQPWSVSPAGQVSAIGQPFRCEQRTRQLASHFALGAGRQLLAAECGGGGYLWDLDPSGRPRQPARRSPRIGDISINQLALSPDGHVLASARQDGTVRLCSTR